MAKKVVVRIVKAAIAVGGLLMTTDGVRSIGNEVASLGLSPVESMIAGFLAILVVLAWAFWSQHNDVRSRDKEIADLKALLSNQNRSATERLRDLKLEGESLAHTHFYRSLEKGLWDREWASWKERVLKCLEDPAWGSARAEFISIPQPQPNQDFNPDHEMYIEFQKDAMLNAQVAFVSRLLVP